MVGVTGLAAGAVALSPIGSAIAQMYGVATAVNEFFDDHIEKLKASGNKTVHCTGTVLEGAKDGFLIGYISSMTIIAVGQMLLGNPLSAVGTVVTGLTLTNPIAMTCAAVGAIYYGWVALSDDERNNILAKAAEGLRLGVEMIRSMIAFVQRSLKDALDSKQLAEFKVFIANQAKLFGKSLSDVTGKIGDMVKGAADSVAQWTGIAADKVADVAVSAASGAYDVVASGAESISDVTKKSADRIARSASDVKNSTKRLISKDKPSD